MKYSVSKDLENNKLINGLLNFCDLKEVLTKVEEYDEIYLLDDYYYGKFYINTPNLTIIGKETYSTLDYDAYHGLIIRDIDGGDGVKTYGTTGSSSVTVLKSAHNFRCKNLIIKNSYKRVIGDIHTQNVAFKTESTNGYYYNVKFIGAQDTLYIDDNDNVFDNCYIEGDVDFIFGSGNAIIKNSTIKLLDILTSSAYLCAPDTYTCNKYGFIFLDCKVLSEGTNEKYLGRAWYPSGAKKEVKPRCYFKNVSFPSDIDLKLIQMHQGDPETYIYYLSNCIKDNLNINNSNEEIDLFYQEYIDKLLNTI